MKAMLALVERHKQGELLGIYGVCSAHPLVLEAALRLAAQDNRLLLIEATSNQVDQFGGYTGMTPADFVTLFISSQKNVTFHGSSLFWVVII